MCKISRRSLLNIIYYKLYYLSGCCSLNCCRAIIDSKLKLGISRRSICGRPSTIRMPSTGPLQTEWDICSVVRHFACISNKVNSHQTAGAIGDL